MEYGGNPKCQITNTKQVSHFAQPLPSGLRPASKATRGKPNSKIQTQKSNPLFIFWNLRLGICLPARSGSDGELEICDLIFSSEFHARKDLDENRNDGLINVVSHDGGESVSDALVGGDELVVAHWGILCFWLCIENVKQYFLSVHDERVRTHCCIFGSIPSRKVCSLLCELQIGCDGVLKRILLHMYAHE